MSKRRTLAFIQSLLAVLLLAGISGPGAAADARMTALDVSDAVNSYRQDR